MLHIFYTLVSKLNAFIKILYILAFKTMLETQKMLTKFEGLSYTTHVKKNLKIYKMKTLKIKQIVYLYVQYEALGT